MSAKLLSEYLKENTKQFHDHVEAKYQSQRIFDKSYTLDHYRKIIWFNYLFHLNFEKIVFEKINEETAKAIQLEARRKLNLLEIDLENLSLERNKPDDLIFVENEAEAMGVLYVMEGSSLGGNVIKKQLSANPYFADVNFNYFGCYDQKTGEYWKNFKEILDHKFTEPQFSQVLAGTKKAYQFLLDI